MVRPVDAVIKELKQLHNHCTIHLRFTAELAKRATVKNEADSALRHPVLLLTDRVRAGQLHIEYCLTSDIWAGKSATGHNISQVSEIDLEPDMAASGWIVMDTNKIRGDNHWSVLGKM